MTPVLAWLDHEDTQQHPEAWEGHFLRRRLRPAAPTEWTLAPHRKRLLRHRPWVAKNWDEPASTWPERVGSPPRVVPQHARAFALGATVARSSSVSITTLCRIMWSAAQSSVQR